MSGVAADACPGCFEPSSDGNLCGDCVTVVPDDDALPVGTLLKFNAYRLGIMLGRGGFGITYLAWDVPNRRRVAIKEYFPKDFGRRLPDRKTVHYRAATLADPFEHGLQKFVEEGRKLWDLRLPTGEKHPYIVEIYDTFPGHETAYIAMEYLGRRTLEDWLTGQPGGTTSFEQIRKILTPIMDGLYFIHEHHLYHRDISPDNMCITDGRGIKLIDFGAAKFAVKEADPSRTLSITIRDGYSPYEQYASIGYGPWTDVYALGATFYRALMGFPPERATNRQFEVGEGREDPLKTLQNAPPHAAAAIHKALSIAARNRYQTVREFQADLQLPEALATSAKPSDASEPSLVLANDGPGTSEPRISSRGSTVPRASHELPNSVTIAPARVEGSARRFARALSRFVRALSIVLFIVGSVLCAVAAYRASPDWITVGLWALLAVAFAFWARWLLVRKARLT